MDALADDTRRSLIEATRQSLMRIALAFGLLNAVVPLIDVLLSGPGARTLGLAVAWVAAWMVAIFNADRVCEILEHRASRIVFVAGGSALTAATILATGGIESPLANGASWLGWAATVVMSRRAAFGVAGILALAPLTAFAIDAGGPAGLVDAGHQYAIVTGPLNPLIIVVVALALAGVFKSVIAAMPGTLWELRDGAPASTPALHALLAGDRPGQARLAPSGGPAPDRDSARDEPSAELTALGGPGRLTLSADEQAIVDGLADGLVPKEIARELGATKHAVYSRIASAKRKVGARTIEHLVALAWRPQR